ncbi:conjugal transfer protein TraD [Blastomonas fulva]|uniref:Uncharacterized protein n=1 Tax=Blastomonas fulva TaxID=1550728 RepID=A0ABM6MB45_9SPHN|nr:hypothetical protein B5J99_18245 [Blastomonas fulva]
MRDWRVKRRERTRQLIELGGLIAKAELIDLTDDDRAPSPDLVAVDLTGSHDDPACCLRDGRGIADWSFTNNRRIKPHAKTT